MNIIQMLPTIAYGDAVGNDTLAIDALLKKQGYTTAIYAVRIDDRLPKGTAFPVSDYRDDKDTLIIYHFSTGDPLNEKLLEFQARVLLIYHNVTPASWFRKYDAGLYNLCSEGRRQLKLLTKRAERCFADSAYNAEELRHQGFTCPIDVVPILIPFEDYKKEADENVLRQLQDDLTNILFVGRIAPNKKQEDLIRSFACYQRRINPESRLILAGSYKSEEEYARRLKIYTEKLGARHVIMTGHISFAGILACYQSADLFLCLSEHEGFCVPLVEAMTFRLPIVAYDAAAVGETAGDAALVLADKDPRLVAEAMDLALTDQRVHDRLIENGQQRLKDFDRTTIENKITNVLKCLQS